MTVATWFRRVRRIESLVAACAVFHAGVAFTLAVAPNGQLLTAGTTPALELMSRYLWALLFAVAAVLVGLVLNPRCRRLRGVAWILALALGGGGWLTSLLIATWSGGGSAVAAFVWAFLYVLWACTAVVHSLDRR